MSDAPELNLDPLKAWGFAPGSYMCICSECQQQHMADKRAWRCLSCAEKCADLVDALVSAAKREALMEAAEAVNEVREGFVALLGACPKGDPDRLIHAQGVEATRQAFNAVHALTEKGTTDDR